MTTPTSAHLSVFLPGRLTNPLNQRWHWTKRAAWAKEWRSKTALMVGAQRATLLGRGYRSFASDFAATPKDIQFLGHVWSLFDDDGLRAALKPCLDGLIDARMLHSDAPSSGHQIDYRQTVNRKTPGVTVRIALA